MANLPGTRIRDNGAFGTITDNPLTVGAVTFNSADLADLSVVAGNHAIVTLDPLREFGDPEIIMITAHTAAATVATIQRGMFGTVARQHTQGTLWVHAATNDDFIRIVTSATRPADVYRGQRIFETDTNRYVGRSTSDVWQQDGLFFDPPACRVYHNTTQTANDSTETVVLFNSERFDTDGMHSTVSNTGRITFNTAGIYVVSLVIGLTTRNDYAMVYTFIRANGTNALGYNQIKPTTYNSGLNLPITVVYKFAVGDYVEALIFQDNTANAVGTVDQGSGSWSPEFSACWIGRGN